MLISQNVSHHPHLKKKKKKKSEVLYFSSTTTVHLFKDILTKSLIVLQDMITVRLYFLWGGGGDDPGIERGNVSSDLLDLTFLFLDNPVLLIPSIISPFSSSSSPLDGCIWSGSCGSGGIGGDTSCKSVLSMSWEVWSDVRVMELVFWLSVKLLLCESCKIDRKIGIELEWLFYLFGARKAIILVNKQKDTKFLSEGLDKVEWMPH